MAYEGAFRCAVLTPTRELYADDVYYADIPGYAGHYGVVKGHSSLVATNHQGGKLTLWLDPEGKEQKVFFVHRGCTQMLHDHLAILCRFGCPIDEIDAESVKAKAEALRVEIEERKKSVETETDEERKAYDKAWIANETMHLSWYDAQIEYAETGHESYKQ